MKILVCTILKLAAVTGNPETLAEGCRDMSVAAATKAIQKCTSGPTCDVSSVVASDGRRRVTLTTTVSAKK